MDLEMEYLLKDVLGDLDNLQEYYLCQKESVEAHVSENIAKYKYGIIIDRFFASKVLGEDHINLTQKELNTIDDIIEEYEIEENDEVAITYKLKPNLDLDKYELNPQIARTEFLKLIQQPNILCESVLMMILIKYEEAISDIYRLLLEKYPQAYLSDKNITYAELVSLNSNIDDIKELFIKKEIDEFMRQPISDWYNSFQKRHKADFLFDNNDFENFIEIYYRRNIIVHNQGIVNDVYVKNVEHTDLNIGQKAVVDDAYIKNALECKLREVTAMLAEQNGRIPAASGR